MARPSLFLPLFAVLPALLLVASGCGGGDTTSASSSGTTATGTTTAATTGTGGSGTGGSGGEGGILITGSGGSGGQGGAPDPCLGVSCPPDQHCEKASGMCANNACADLVCGPTEICQMTPGGGAVCKDISCTADVDCPAGNYCNPEGSCAALACTPNSTTCADESTRRVCSADGRTLFIADGNRGSTEPSHRVRRVVLSVNDK